MVYIESMPSQINAAELTTYDVDPEGQFVRLHLRDQHGAPGTLVLPTDCLTQLLMSLPEWSKKHCAIVRATIPCGSRILWKASM